MESKKQAQVQHIRKLAQNLDIEILAHIYQRQEVRQAADFVGGSVELVERALTGGASNVLICGAMFIIGEIKRLKPSLKLIVPRQDLSCPLAEAVDKDDIIAASKEFPEALLVADIKAKPEIRDMADVRISPDNAFDVLNSLKGRPLIMLPGPYLADLHGFGSQVVKRWPQAVCQVHEQVLTEELAASQAGHPQALTAVNLLCRPDLHKMADFVGDAAAIRDFCGSSSAKEFIIVSEAGLAEYLEGAHPEKKFYETEVEIYCPNMKLTNLKSIIRALETCAENIKPDLMQIAEMEALL